MAKDIITEKRSKEIKLLEKNFSIAVNRENSEKKETELLMTRGLDEKIQEMKYEIMRDSKKREDYEDFKT